MQLLKKSNRRELFLELYIAVVFTVFTAFRVSSSASFLLMAVLSFVFWFGITWIAIRLFEPIRNKCRSIFGKMDQTMDKISNTPFFFLCLGILVVLWIPAYLALFPGGFLYDGPEQLCQWLGLMELWDNHPIAHTVLLGVLYDIGSTIGKTPNAGIAVYSAVQMITVAGAFACLFRVMKQSGASAIFLLLSFIWVAINPFLQVLSLCSTKDIFFGAFMLFFMSFFYLWLNNDKASRKVLIPCMIFGLLMCLFRHPVIHIFAFLLILIPFFKLTRSKKIWTMAAIAVVIVIAGAFSLICHNVLHLKSGNQRELLSVPMQQMAYVCNLHLNGNDVKISEEQLAQVETFISEEGIMNYQPDSADPVKSTFDTESYKNHLSDNLKLYFELGIHNPVEYAFAFRSLVYPYFLSEEMPHVGLMFLDPSEAMQNKTQVIRDSKFMLYYKVLLYETAGMGYSRIPIAASLFRPGLCIWLIAASIGISVYRKKGNNLLLLIPMALYAVALLIGPVALVRYLFPLIMLVPFLFFLILSGKKEDFTKGK